MKVNHDSSSSNEVNPMDKLLAKLSEQQATLAKQHEALKSTEDKLIYRTVEYVSANSSVPITPATESYNFSTAPTTNPPSISGDEAPPQTASELAFLKAELEAAKGKIARMDQELAQTRITKHTLDQVVGNASEADYPMNLPSEERFTHGPPPLARPQFTRDNSWATQDDARSDTSDALSASGFNRARAIWNNGSKPNFAGPNPSFVGVPGPVPPFQPSDTLGSSQWMQRGYGQPFVESLPYGAAQVNAFRGDRMMQDPDMLMAPPPMGRRNQAGGGRFNNRSSASSFPYASSNSSFDGYTPSSTPYGSVANLPAMSGMGMNNMYGSYQPQPIGTPLSPHAPEFTSSTAGWKSEVCHPRSLFYFAPSTFINKLADTCFRGPDVPSYN